MRAMAVITLITLPGTFSSKYHDASMYSSSKHTNHSPSPIKSLGSREAENRNPFDPIDLTKPSIEHRDSATKLLALSQTPRRC